MSSSIGHSEIEHLLKRHLQRQARDEEVASHHSSARTHSSNQSNNSKESEWSFPGASSSGVAKSEASSEVKTERSVASAGAIFDMAAPGPASAEGAPPRDEMEEGSEKKRKKSGIEDPMSHRVIEKRRRDRMNRCLADLSRLIPSSYMRKGRGRIEKTEIIEMSIKHIRHLQLHANCRSIEKCELGNSSSSSSVFASKASTKAFADASSQADLSVSSKKNVESFRLGYHECLSETMHFLVEGEGMYSGDPFCQRLISHMQKYFEKLNKVKRQSQRLATNANQHCPPPEAPDNIMTSAAQTTTSSLTMASPTPYQATYQFSPCGDSAGLSGYQSVTASEYQSAATSGYQSAATSGYQSSTGSAMLPSDSESGGGGGKSSHRHDQTRLRTLCSSLSVQKGLRKKKRVAVEDSGPNWDNKDRSGFYLHSQAYRQNHDDPENLSTRSDPIPQKQSLPPYSGSSSSSNWTVTSADHLRFASSSLASVANCHLSESRSSDEAPGKYKFKANLSERFQHHHSQQHVHGGKQQVPRSDLDKAKAKQRHTEMEADASQFTDLNKHSKGQGAGSSLRIFSDCAAPSSLPMSLRLPSTSTSESSAAAICQLGSNPDPRSRQSDICHPESNAPSQGQPPAPAQVLPPHQSGTQVPIFALHPRGAYYIPLSIDYSLVAPVMLVFSDTEEAGNGVVLHPITINVNFCGPVHTAIAVPANTGPRTEATGTRADDVSVGERSGGRKRMQQFDQQHNTDGASVWRERLDGLITRSSGDPDEGKEEMETAQ